ncbi:MAG: response regulator transcription factor [Bacilli bacterium]|nr:response regulator transcription factor [Bacilli bacterium]
MNILIVDDESLIREVIKEYCINAKYKVIEACNGEEAINIVKENNIDVIILDVMMPKLDGFSACKEIKKIKDIPIIVLSARTNEIDKLYGFDLGIDDYMIKPFSPKELIARIKAVTSRIKKQEEVFKYKDLVINFKSRFVSIKNKEIFLTPKQYELLFYFINNKGVALSRDQIITNIWGYDFYGDDRTIDSHIKILRNNLGEYKDLIITVRGMGYKFETKD